MGFLFEIIDSVIANLLFIFLIFVLVYYVFKDLIIDNIKKLITYVIDQAK